MGIGLLLALAQHFIKGSSLDTTAAIEAQDRWAEEQERIAKEYKYDGYNSYGFDVDGYSREGYNRNGFGRDGYNKEGYDRQGFNRNGVSYTGLQKFHYGSDGYCILSGGEGINPFGYDREGFHWRTKLAKDGYDREGYDGKNRHRDGTIKAGFDIDGYDINGYDRYGYDREGYDIYEENIQGYDKAGNYCHDDYD